MKMKEVESHQRLLADAQSSLELFNKILPSTTIKPKPKKIKPKPAPGLKRNNSELEV